jgi:hypothetical protein
MGVPRPSCGNPAGMETIMNVEQILDFTDTANDSDLERIFAAACLEAAKRGTQRFLEYLDHADDEVWQEEFFSSVEAYCENRG